ncbi:MAG: hypothetical protein A2857_04490 [Candidatus Levybacteria bacterium RIFCSPHIGHO2_01_FULL_36_15]|nr:MAG: hypothetical protein A2857_04490 [Candidatus Levybacteria bacterium RIFCSPHIGHO2_01_FULL_36_15]OGH38612.1 MAG: hypothetical protein A2905_03245 [Candidatus Levybacteria bacterium RIFCSPLOWO2_01_FULL_36_10]
MSNETVKEETIKADPIFDEAKDESELQNDIKAGEWQKLRQFETYKRRSRQGRIIATHQAVCNRIKQLETLFYQLVRNHPAKAVKLLNEIKRLRFLAEWLLQSLIWEERGQLEDHEMPPELEPLL